MDAPETSTSPMRQNIERIVLIALVIAFAVVTYIVVRRPAGVGEEPKATRDIIGVIISAGLTLIMYSFLYRDNPLFKMAENLYVGVALGYEAILVWRQSLVPEIVDPLFRAPTGQALVSAIMERGIAILLGLMLLTRLSKKHSWFSRYSYGLMIGWWAGFGIYAVTDSMILKQLQASVAGLQKDVADSAWASTLFSGDWFTQVGLPIFGSAVLLVGVVSVLFYFFFSIEHRGPAGAVSKVGIWFLMVAFGAMFGYTVMGRLALLIDRFDFLLFDWLKLKNNLGI